MRAAPVSYNECHDKHAFTSKDAARRAHAKAHWRLRVYYCVPCLGWHVANAEKFQRKDRW